MNTEPANAAVAGDPSVSAQAGAFAHLVAGEPNSARPFLHMPTALARLTRHARFVCREISAEIPVTLNFLSRGDKT